MPVQITTGVILAAVAVLGLVVTVVKSTNKRFKEAEDDLEELRLMHTGCAARTGVRLENMKELQEAHGKKLSSVGESVAWLVKWAKNGGTK